MNKSLKTAKDRLYEGASALGSVIAGAAITVTASPVLGGGSILLGAGALVTTFVGALLFRPRSDAEIQRLLGKSTALDEIQQLVSQPKVIPAVAPAQSRRAAQKKLIATMDKVINAKDMLGPEIRNASACIFEDLDIITRKWDELEGYAEIRYTVEMMIDDYLPTSIQSYLNIPSGGDEKLAAKLKAELLDQLRILRIESAKIRKNLLNNDIQSFNVQGNFLKARFRQNDPTNELVLTRQGNKATQRSIPLADPPVIR